MPTEPQKNPTLTSDEQRKLRALLYTLTPVEMIEVIAEVIQRQKMNAPPKHERDAGYD